jgi:hypothetical protein
MNPTESNEREEKDIEQTADSDTVDERLELWLDGRLPEEERARFEAELERNPEQKEEAHSLASLLSVVRNLPEERAPRNLLSDVQSRLRGQTEGRAYGGPKLYARFPYEALVQSLLLIGAVLIFALASPRPPKVIVMEPRSGLVGSEGDGGLGAIAEFGTFEEERRLEPTGPRHLVGEVPRARLEGLRAEVSRHPPMKIVSEVGTDGDKVEVRILFKP